MKRPASLSKRRSSFNPSNSKNRIVVTGSLTRIMVWRYLIVLATPFVAIHTQFIAEAAISILGSCQIWAGSYTKARARRIALRNGKMEDRTENKAWFPKLAGNQGKAWLAGSAILAFP